MSVQAWAAAAEPWGSGFKAGVGALSDAALLDLLQRYKRQVAKRYRVVEPELLEQLLPREELCFSPKLDGELWFLVKRGRDLALVAYNGRVLVGTAITKGLAEHLTKQGISGCIVAGELFASTSSERSRSHHTGLMLAEPNGEEALSFVAFDLVSVDSEDRLATLYEERIAWLEAHLGSFGRPSVRVVLTEKGEPKAVAEKYREWVLGQRHEGVVVRSARGLTYKIKPTSTVDMVVLAFGERVTGDVRQVRELQVGLVREDGNVQLVGSVGTGFSEDDRARWHAKLAALECKSGFRLANREGTLCRFVRPEVVVEVRVSDFLTTDAWDAPLRRMALAYDPEKGWSALNELRTVVPLHPVLVRERTDKHANAKDAGLEQVRAWLEAESAPEALTASTSLASELVKRGVFTKETKGALAVRKYVVIKTNKESQRTHPPYVVVFTDYSAGRKEPLQLTLRTASTLEASTRHVDAWLAENIKKGWVQAAG